MISYNRKERAEQLEYSLRNDSLFNEYSKRLKYCEDNNEPLSILPIHAISEKRLFALSLLKGVFDNSLSESLQFDCNESYHEQTAQIIFNNSRGLQPGITKEQALNKIKEISKQLSNVEMQSAIFAEYILKSVPLFISYDVRTIIIEMTKKLKESYK